MVLDKTLHKLGFTVLSAKDGMEGWALFQKEHPSVVITDWMMPHMDGLELCRRIRGEAQHDRYTYLIVLTALGGKHNYLEAMNAGGDDFLTKPFDPDELVTRLRVAERILAMETTLGYLAALHTCCPECHRVRVEGGRWLGLRQVARGRAASTRAPARCPDCQPKDVAFSPCPAPAAGAPTLK
jgi:DNA-binding response OmpR family regulator